MIQVFAAKMLRQSADQHSFIEVAEFLPMNLKWSHTGEIFALGLSPNMGKHCDLGHVVDPQFRQQFGYDLPYVSDNQTILTLDLEFRAATNGYLIRPGTYQLQIRIAGGNCAVVNKTLELTVTGNWFPQQDRMFAEGLGIRLLH
jgi:hypothetical protein